MCPSYTPCFGTDRRHSSGPSPLMPPFPVSGALRFSLDPGPAHAWPRRRPALCAFSPVFAWAALNTTNPCASSMWPCLSTWCLSFWRSPPSTMKRTVPGAVANILRDGFGANLTETFSVLDVMRLTGAEGGWDVFLQLVFATFVVVGPIVRASAELLLAWGPMSPKPQMSMSFLVSSMGSFSAWEVLLLGLVLVDLEMPGITNM